MRRVIGFELQLGPFAVAQLRVLAELAELGLDPGTAPGLRTYVTNTLDNPFVEDETLGVYYEPVARSRREANNIKKGEPVFVVIGNPPYKERSRGKGAWVENGSPDAGEPAPLRHFMPPPEWGVGAHVKHLYNPYVYFWRWATWKVFDHHPEQDRGVVCLITVAGFLEGPGFQAMRRYLRQRSDAIWVIGCSPEGHQPPTNTRVFEDVQQPVCIVLAVRDGSTGDDQPASVRFRELFEGVREAKFQELSALTLDDGGWRECPDEWQAPFAPAAQGRWANFPTLAGLPQFVGTFGFDR
jgi:predicted helicase